MAASVAPFYAGWRQLNDRLVETIGSLSAEELAWASAPQMWPIWALAGHLAGTRVYWLCSILGEPGRSETPFADTGDDGWEDDLSRPREAGELVEALRSTFKVVEGCLERWTPDMLPVEFERRRGDVIQLHTRQSIVFRMLTHDASHAGEISQILGGHGRGEIDLWSRLSRVQPRPGCTPRAISQISSASSATPRGAITAKRSVLGTRHDGDDGRGAGDAKAAPSDRGAKVDRTVR